MSMLNWAKREIEIAKEISKQELDQIEIDYGGACYDSALKAFESLTQDGHSGYSIDLTKHFLNRLIDGKPLSQIEDTPDIWNHIDTGADGMTYQCARMSSLFKTDWNDGKTTFRDNNYIQCIDINTKGTYSSGLVHSVMEELYPITMPYMPLDTPMKVYCEDFLTDPKNGDFDTVGVLYVVNPDDEEIIVNQYFKEYDDVWIEISPEEYIERSRIAGLISHIEK